MMKYRNYVARTKIDGKNGLIYGEVVGPRDVITFQGRSVEEAKKAFQESVDLYLETCKKHKLEPDKPFNGAISYRTAPKRHRLLAKKAAIHGISLNRYIDKLVDDALRNRREIVAAKRGPKPETAGAKANRKGRSKSPVEGGAS